MWFSPTAPSCAASLTGHGTPQAAEHPQVGSPLTLTTLGWKRGGGGPPLLSKLPKFCPTRGPSPKTLDRQPPPPPASDSLSAPAGGCDQFPSPFHSCGAEARAALWRAGDLGLGTSLHLLCTLSVTTPQMGLVDQTRQERASVQEVAPWPPAGSSVGQGKFSQWRWVSGSRRGYFSPWGWREAGMFGCSLLEWGEGADPLVGNISRPRACILPADKGWQWRELGAL